MYKNGFTLSLDLGRFGTLLASLVEQGDRNLSRMAHEIGDLIANKLNTASVTSRACTTAGATARATTPASPTTRFTPWGQLRTEMNEWDRSGLRAVGKFLASGRARCLSTWGRRKGAGIVPSLSTQFHFGVATDLPMLMPDCAHKAVGSGRCERRQEGTWRDDRAREFEFETQ